MAGTGTKDDPWELSTAPKTSKYTMWADETADPITLFCQVGSTQLKYQLRCIDDLYAWLVEQGDWVDLGAADEQSPPRKAPSKLGVAPRTTLSAAGTSVRATAVVSGMYLPPLLEALGKAELTHEPRNNKVRAIV